MLVITLIKQMWQYDNKLFQAIFIRTRRSLFNNYNVVILNGKVIVTILILNLDEQVVIVQ